MASKSLIIFFAQHNGLNDNKLEHETFLEKQYSTKENFSKSPLQLFIVSVWNGSLKFYFL